MTQKAILLADPGIDTAFAIALALNDPDIDLLALAATGGNVPPEQATRNVHTLVEHLDPPKWPRLGEALPVPYDIDGTQLHGPGGLGGISFKCAEPHHPHPADKLIADEIHMHPGEVTAVVLGPLTALARAMDRDAQLSRLVKQLIIVGGSLREPGNASAVSEFHFYCDPLAARQVVRSGAPITMIPLDTMRKALFSPTELSEITRVDSRACQFLKRIIPFGISATAQTYGIEGFHLKDVLGVCALAIPKAFKSKPMAVDVETRGELTRGMSVFDLRPQRSEKPNVDLVIEVDMEIVRNYIKTILRIKGEDEGR